MKILVTGAKGVIGKHLVPALKCRGHATLGLDLTHDEREEIDYARCDITQYRQIRKWIERFQPDYVYHLAAEFGRVNGEDYYEQLWTTNVIGTRHILELCADFGIRLIFASSSEAYGDIQVAHMSESMIGDRFIDHHNDYAVTKYVNEGQIRRFIKHKNLQAMILRYFNSYGPGEYYSPYRSVICLFCYRVLHDLPITVYKDYHRVFIYMDDFIATAARAVEDFEHNEAINIGGVEYRNMQDVVDIIEATLGKKAQIRFLSKEQANVTNKRPDIAKARQLLGHDPKITLEKGIPLTLEWMRKIYAS